MEEGAREKSKRKNRECLKCKSTEHGVFNCEQADEEDSRQSWNQYRETWTHAAAGDSLTGHHSKEAITLDALVGGMLIKVLTDSEACVSVIAEICVKKFEERCTVSSSDQIQVSNSSGGIETLTSRAVLSIEFNRPRLLYG